MSLQVWLPLNGDLHNQGLNKIQFTNNGATINDSGKIGKCYSFNGSSNTIYNRNISINCNKLSMCCWIYRNSSSSAEGYVASLNNGAGYTDTAIGLDTSNATTIIFVGGGNSTLRTTITSNTWIHVAVTYDGQKIRGYINGQKIGEQANTTILNKSQLAIGCRCDSTNSFKYYFPGKINDFRLYDHCLSNKEVKEISKGLILHWQLNGPKKLITDTNIPENLFIGSGFSQYDFDNMVGNSSTDWTKHFRWYNGNKNNHTIADGIDTIKLNASGNLGIAFTRKATDINLDPNSYYIISCEAKCTKSGAQLGIGTSYYTTGNSWTWRGGANKFSFSAINTWQTFTYKFKPDSNTQYICYCFTCANGTSGGTDTFSIRHCKLEKGSAATAWNLNKLDDTYISNLIENTSWVKEYDCSGFNNNGTITGTAALITNIPGLSYGIYMNNTNTANHIESDSTIPLLTDGITASFWVKCAKATGQVIFAHPNFEFGILNNLGYVSLTSTAGFNLSNFITNEWNHICVIRNGTTYKLYVNGVAATQNGANNNYVHNASNLYLLNRSHNNNYAANASLSDFRIYVTELSADDIKELYRNSKIINGDNKSPRNLE